jgi:hypothetical protein
MQNRWGKAFAGLFIFILAYGLAVTVFGEQCLLADREFVWDGSAGRIKVAQTQTKCPANLTSYNWPDIYMKYVVTGKPGDHPVDNAWFIWTGAEFHAAPIMPKFTKDGTYYHRFTGWKRIKGDSPRWSAWSPIYFMLWYKNKWVMDKQTWYSTGPVPGLLPFKEYVVAYFVKDNDRFECPADWDCPATWNAIGGGSVANKPQQSLREKGFGMRLRDRDLDIAVPFNRAFTARLLSSDGRLVRVLNGLEGPRAHAHIPQDIRSGIYLVSIDGLAMEAQKIVVRGR